MSQVKHKMKIILNANITYPSINMMQFLIMWLSGRDVQYFTYSKNGWQYGSHKDAEVLSKGGRQVDVGHDVTISDVGGEIILLGSGNDVRHHLLELVQPHPTYHLTQTCTVQQTNTV